MPKLTVISEVTNELIRSSSVTASLSDIRKRMYNPENQPYDRCIDQLNLMRQVTRGSCTPL